MSEFFKNLLKVVSSGENSKGWEKTITPVSPEEKLAFDNELTRNVGLPFYPLEQVVRNQQAVLKAVRMADAECLDAIEIEDQGCGNEPDSRSIPMNGPRYIDEEQIGEGGTAVVYRVTDTRLQRSVALKRFKEEADSNNHKDYLAELSSASLVRHPNVVSTMDADHDGKGRFIVMELIDGYNIEDAISKVLGPFDLNRFINFAIQALEGVHATHRGGLLHLDLKPSNIMISEQVSGRGIVTIVDFGRAQRIVDENGKPPVGLGMNGSIYYCAPEQLLEEELDVRADLYALGCVFYWVLTGKRPFKGDGAIQVMSAHLQHIVRPIEEVEPTLPKWIADLVMSLIECSKEDRPGTISEVIDTLLDGASDSKVKRICQ